MEGLGAWACMGFQDSAIKLETGLGPNSAGIPYTLLLRLEAIGFPTFGLLLGFGMGGGCQAGSLLGLRVFR